jgi:hypoxanthine phosphoribosyltransferase
MQADLERVLFDKATILRRLDQLAAEISSDYVGFDIGDEFVVGYGLDYMEKYRNLPCVGVPRKELISS